MGHCDCVLQARKTCRHSSDARTNCVQRVQLPLARPIRARSRSKSAARAIRSWSSRVADTIARCRAVVACCCCCCCFPCFRALSIPMEIMYFFCKHPIFLDNRFVSNRTHLSARWSLFVRRGAWRAMSSRAGGIRMGAVFLMGLLLDSLFVCCCCCFVFSFGICLLLAPA